MAMHKDNLIWIDLEMTGLDVDHDLILEIATIVTDSSFNVVAEGPSLAIHQSDEVLEKMNPWCQNQHKASGLIERVKKSSVTEMQAEQETLVFLEQYVPANRSPMCGNSICQDRRFLYRHMKQLEAYFHYRHLDVSTLKILAQRFRPKLYKSMIKESRHLAKDDVIDSIQEMKAYHQHFLRLEELTD